MHLTVEQHTSKHSMGEETGSLGGLEGEELCVQKFLNGFSTCRNPSKISNTDAKGQLTVSLCALKVFVIQKEKSQWFFSVLEL